MASIIPVVFLLASFPVHGARPSDKPSCEQLVPVVEIEQRLQQGRKLLEDLETEKYDHVLDTVDDQIHCVAERLPASLAAEYHFQRGIRQFLAGHNDAAALSFAAARALGTPLDFPTTYTSEHPIREVAARVHLEEGTFDDVRPALGGRVYLDGEPRKQRPTSWPTVVQYVPRSQPPDFTVLVPPGADLPSYPVQRPYWLLVLGGALAGASGACGYFAMEAEKDHGTTAESPTATREDLEELYSRNHTMFISGTVAGGLAAATVATFFVVSF